MPPAFGPVGFSVVVVVEPFFLGPLGVVLGPSGVVDGVGGVPGVVVTLFLGSSDETVVAGVSGVVVTVVLGSCVEKVVDVVYC